MTWRSSVIAARPPASTASSASRAWSGSRSSTLRAAPAWMTITLTLWPTTSCSSRARRARSCSSASAVAASLLAMRGLGALPPGVDGVGAQPDRREQQEDHRAGIEVGQVVAVAADDHAQPVSTLHTSARLRYRL